LRNDSVTLSVMSARACARLGGYSLSSVARTPGLMSYDILRTDDTTYSWRVS